MDENAARLDRVLNLVSDVIGRAGTAEAKADVALSAIGLLIGLMALGRTDPAAQIDRSLIALTRLLTHEGDNVAKLEEEDPQRLIVLAKTAAVEQLRRAAEAAVADFSPGGSLHQAKP